MEECQNLTLTSTSDVGVVEDSNPIQLSGVEGCCKSDSDSGGVACAWHN